MGNTTLTGGSVSGSWALPTIPRATSITTFNDFTIGNNIPCVFDKKSTSFTTNITLYVGSTLVASRNGVADSYTLVLSSGEQDIIYNTIPNATSVVVTLNCIMMSGSTQIGSTQSANATATVGFSIVPTFTALTAAETVTAVSTNAGLFVQNLSRILFTITGAAGIKGSTITGYQINYDGTISNTSSITSGAINKSGNISVTGTVTDSRGRTFSRTITVNLLAYAMPSVTGFDVTRANSDGTANPMGTYAKVVSTGTAQSLMNGTQKNTLTYVLYSRVRGTTPWTTKKTLLISGLSLNATDVFSGYTATSSYEWRLDITDKFNTTISLDLLSTGEVAMSWGKSGVGVGKVWEQGSLDVAGDGSTNFNLPNLKGRVPAGLDSAQTEFDTCGKTGGAKTVTLTINEMPSHSGHHDPGGGIAAYMQQSVLTSYGSVGRGWAIQSGNEAIPVTVSTGNGLAHNNLQPYIVLNYIIKC